MSELKKKRKKKKEVEISSLFIMIEKIFSRPKSCTEKTFFKGSCKFDFMKKLSVISNISCKKNNPTCYCTCGSAQLFKVNTSYVWE